MSTGTIPACGLGLTAATLSAWRDNALSAAEAERVRAHVAGCDACRGRLAEYDSISRALHARWIPEPDERLWLAMRAGMAARPAGRRPLSLTPNPKRTWRSLAAVAAMLLLVAGFAQALRVVSRGHVITTKTPTATEAPVSTLSWQAAPGQGALTSAGGRASFATAPSDGNTAYACVVPGGAPGQRITVWVTHDRASHWTRAADLPASGQTADANTQCALTADATDSRRVALAVYWHVARTGPSPLSASTFVTTDGGAVWRELTSPQPFTIGEMATHQGSTYAIRSTQPDPATVAGDLSVSRDGLRTWQLIDQAIVAAGQRVVAFWINPGSGEILAEATSQTGAPEPAPLWDTRDGGRTWTQLPDPTLITGGDFVVQASSAAGQPWDICYLYQDAADHPGQANQLLCSTDGGQTWLPRPTLNFTFTCLKCSGAPGTPTTEVFPMFPVAIADDGALLATVEVPQAPVTVPSSGGPPPILTLYRLPAGGEAWQSLGALPHSTDAETGELLYGDTAYAVSPGQGLFWSIGADGAILTATYP